MSRILIINHYWPPTGGPCVQRWVDYSQYLVQKGHQVTVIAPVDAGFKITDESLNDRVHKDINVVLLGKKSIVSNSRSIIGENALTYFARGNFFLPDPRKFWNKYVIEYLTNKINDFDVLVTAGPPHSTHLIGLHFSDKIKWIADLHDYWTDAIYLKKFFRTPLAHFLDRRLEKKVLNAADTVFVHSEDAKLLLSKRTNKPIEVITMGFYDDLFVENKQQVVKGQISHIGSFFESYTEGLKFMTHLCNSGFDVLQVGPVDKKVIFDERIKVIPPVSHSKAIEIMQQSEYLLLINPYQHHLPGKIFEYLGANRTILLASPKGSEAEQIIKDSKQLSYEEIFSKYARSSIAKNVEQIIVKLSS